MRLTTRGRWTFALLFAAVVWALLSLIGVSTPPEDPRYCIDGPQGGLSCYHHGDVPPGEKIVWYGPAAKIPGATR